MGFRHAAIVAAAVFTAAGMTYAQDQGGDKPAMKQPAKKPTRKEVTLKVGDKAPEIAVAKWVKGDPVTGFEKGRTYVVEFWATWCGPCKVSIPHLTQLQKEHPDIKFVGVSVWERDQGKVEPFVKDEGDQMVYNVAMDDVPPLPEGVKPDTREAQSFYVGNGKMSQSWMAAAGQHGIPTAFIVDGEGKIAYIGHPMWLEIPLEEVGKPGFSPEKAEAKVKAAEEKLDEVMEASRGDDAREALDKFNDFEKEYPGVASMFTDTKYAVLLKAKDPRAEELGRTLVADAVKGNNLGKLMSVVMHQEPSEAVKNIRAFERANPKSADQLALLKYTMLLKAGDPEASEVGQKLLDKAAKDKDVQSLNQIAWSIVDPKAGVEHRDLDLAMRAASKAVEITGSKGGAVLDTLAWTYYHKGDKAKAIELEKKAIEAAPEQMKEELEQSLKTFEEGAK